MERPLDIAREILLAIPEDWVSARKSSDRFQEGRQVGSPLLEPDEGVRERAKALVLVIERGREMDARRTQVRVGRELTRHCDDPGNGELGRDDLLTVGERSFDGPDGDRLTDV